DISAVDLAAPDALGYQRQGLGPNRLAPRAGRNWPYAAWPLALTAEDVAKWDASILKRSLLKPASYDEQVRTIKLNSGKDSGYAMGLFVRKDLGRTEYQHGGEGAGYLSENRIYPDEGLAIVVLTNTMSGSAQADIADRIAFMYLAPQGADATVLGLFESLQSGKVDRSGLTPNCSDYLSDQALADFRDNLGALGKPVTLKMTNSSQRGGMEGRSYRIRTESGKLVAVSVYLTKDGKVEQFLVSLVS
ncbi:MAG: serine hydrolase, partial [Asticcacaulis sp.]|nr:serine hydrolase [Asticcacaulis sp.]